MGAPKKMNAQRKSTVNRCDVKSETVRLKSAVRATCLVLRCCLVFVVDKYFSRTSDYANACFLEKDANLANTDIYMYSYVSSLVLLAKVLNTGRCATKRAQRVVQNI